MKINWIKVNKNSKYRIQGLGSKGLGKLFRKNAIESHAVL